MRSRPVILLISAAFALLCAGGCEKERSGSGSSGTPTPAVETGWHTETIVEGALWKSFAGMDFSITNASQIVNVMEIDLTNPKFHVKFHNGNVDNLWATDDVFADKRYNEGAICCINGAFEPASVYIRVDGTTYYNISSSVIPDTDIRQWKSEGCVSSDRNHDVRIEYDAPAEECDYLAAREAYDQMTDRQDLFSSSPVLISDGQPVGETFVDRMIASGLYGGFKGMPPQTIQLLPYENPIRHQGVRHPRTVVALTSDHKFLMVTVDGRWSTAAGMTAKEVTKFLLRHFPLTKYALNLDGGGSTCMCVLDRGAASNNVVNYPCNDDTFDHLGVRSVTTHIYVTSD